MEDSWKTAFRILSEQLDPTMKLSTRDVEEWTLSKISLLNEQSSQIFNRYDTLKKGVGLLYNVVYRVSEFQGIRVEFRSDRNKG
jgi:hypothetical protein